MKKPEEAVVWLVGALVGGWLTISLILLTLRYIAQAF
jgi:hypothetical protein